jgi:hypothetical protein
MNNTVQSRLENNSMKSFTRDYISGKLILFPMPSDLGTHSKADSSSRPEALNIGDSGAICGATSKASNFQAQI